MIKKRCSTGGRHWFTYYGWVGSSSPSCRHCGADNPKYRPEDDPFAEPYPPVDHESAEAEAERVIAKRPRS